LNNKEKITAVAASFCKKSSLATNNFSKAYPSPINRNYSKFANTVLPVKFNEKLSDCSLSYDATVAEFECFAEPSALFDGEIPPCQWYHGNELIDTGDEKYQIISDGNRHVLKVCTDSRFFRSSANIYSGARARLRQNWA